MEGALMLEISKKIKKTRIERSLTVQEVASRSNVTKGLISQIENGRSLPSLPVLFKIIASLDITINDFFSGLDKELIDEPIVVKKNADYEDFQKEDAIGFNYRRVMAQDIPDSTIDIVLLTLEPGSSRPLVQTAALEYKYILSGTVRYEIDGSFYDLEAGDSIFFNGMLPHVPKTLSATPSVMLIIYFFNKQK